MLAHLSLKSSELATFINLEQSLSASIAMLFNRQILLNTLESFEKNLYGMFFVGPSTIWLNEI